MFKLLVQYLYLERTCSWISARK